MRSKIAQLITVVSFEYCVFLAADVSVKKEKKKKAHPQI